MFVAFGDPKSRLCSVHEERPPKVGKQIRTYCGKAVKDANRMKRRPYSRPACRQCAVSKKKAMDK